VEADLSRHESVAPMFDRIEQQYGPVDYLVNNAGINRDVLLAFMSEEQWDEVIDTNLRGTYLCSRFALLGMMRQGSGSHLQYRVAQRSPRPSRPVQLLGFQREA
jgi:3-oxoacyl-[acyl-carrier protein] reductase